MPRPPSKHGLEKKFKPWRKGKSKNSKAKSSVKHQLRGQERLLAKLASDDSERRKEIEMKIKDLKRQIDQKKATEVERQNASKSHGIRFLERQKLVRMERNARRNAKTVNEHILRKIALDQVYVAHFPHDIKYMPLFRKSERIVDDQRMLRRRAITRQRILKMVNDTDERVQWMSESQYKCLPTSWTIEQEEAMFGRRLMNDNKKVSEEKELVNDSRFTLSVNHEKLIKAAEKFDNEEDLLAGEDDGSSVKSDEQSSFHSDDNEIDKLSSFHDKIAQSPERGGDNPSSSTDSSSDDDSESSDSDDQSSTCSADKVLSLDEANQCKDKKDLKRNLQEGETYYENEEDDVDDFFLPVSNENAFEKAQAEKQNGIGSGDKSKGWASQRQRPGEWKKKRRRY